MGSEWKSSGPADALGGWCSAICSLQFADFELILHALPQRAAGCQPSGGPADLSSKEALGRERGSERARGDTNKGERERERERERESARARDK